MTKRYQLLVFVTILSLSLSLINVFADVPSVTELMIDMNGDLLTIDIRHSSPSSSHYVDEIQVDIDGNVSVYDLTEQSSNTFNVNVTVDTDGASEIMVRAHCNVHGWSTWSILEGDEEPIEESDGGIPGYPPESVLMSLILVIILWQNHKR